MRHQPDLGCVHVNACMRLYRCGHHICCWFFHHVQSGVCQQEPHLCSVTFSVMNQKTTSQRFFVEPHFMWQRSGTMGHLLVTWAYCTLACSEHWEELFHWCARALSLFSPLHNMNGTWRTWIHPSVMFQQLLEQPYFICVSCSVSVCCEVLTVAIVVGLGAG